MNRKGGIYPVAMDDVMLHETTIDCRGSRAVLAHPLLVNS